MDLLFENLDLMKVLTISLIHLAQEQHALDLFYHVYFVHQSKKCTFTNLIFPQSKQTCDLIMAELISENDPVIVAFIEKLRHKIHTQPFDPNTDAIDVAKEIFLGINSSLKKLNREPSEPFLSVEEFKSCCFFEKELILYRCLNHEQRNHFFHKKTIQSKFRKNMTEIYSELDKKCSMQLYDRISKRNKLEPILWKIRKHYGDDLILACGDQKKKMDLILFVIQKLYL